jgi:DNA polymerase bacteriophage-type
MLYLDFETFNTRHINVGTYAYAETAEVLLTAYAKDDGPVQLWHRASGQTLPPDLWRWLNDPKITLVAHNAIFDRNILKSALDLDTDLTRWHCTMVQAMAHGFIGRLGRLCEIFKLNPDEAKLQEGKKLINRFCKPAPKNHKADRYDATTHPEEWDRFCEYAKQDITSMRILKNRLPNWNYRNTELALYHLDQKINDRGFCVDCELVNAGARAAVTEKENLAKRFIEITGGDVEAPTQREKFKNYLNKRFGFDLDNTRATTFRDMIDAGGLPPEAKELMQVSMLANKTSTAKYKTLAPAISSDNRFRGGLQFDGAVRTRRWAGRVFQPHNLPSRGLPPEATIEAYIRALKAGCHGYLFDDLMLLGSASLRGVLVAAPGKKLVVSDLKNIEGRANAYLANETWKLEAFEAFDRGEGPDLYNVTAGGILGKDPYSLTKTERNVMGKIPELALGYEGGFGAFQTFSKSYGVQMADHWGIIQQNVPRKFINQAKENWDIWGRGKSPDTDPIEWYASESVKLGWRDRHPGIVRLWRSCNIAFKRALEKPGTAFKAGKWLKFKCVTHAGFKYLLMRLPSGNFLVYFNPKVTYTNSEKTRFDLSYEGLDSTDGRYHWTRIYTYGGKLVENACQSLSRDILGANMPAAEAAGYEIVLTVHDENVTETPDRPEFNAEHLSEIMSIVPDYLPGFPLAAEGFAAQRYRKG